MVLGCKYLDFVFPTHCDLVVYSNFFIAKKEIYFEYIDTVIKPLIEWLENEPIIQQMLWSNSGYMGLQKEQLKEYTGLDHYTYHTFVLERFFSIYYQNKLANKNLKIATFK